jgi:hypothetical protein
VERTVIPAVIRPFQCLLLLGHAVRIISGVIMVSYISHNINVRSYRDKFELHVKRTHDYQW